MGKAKRAKKITALALALVLVFSFSCTAFASTTKTVTGTKSNISGIDMSGGSKTVGVNYYTPKQSANFIKDFTIKCTLPSSSLSDVTKTYVSNHTKVSNTAGLAVGATCTSITKSGKTLKARYTITMSFVAIGTIPAGITTNVGGGYVTVTYKI